MLKAASTSKVQRADRISDGLKQALNSPTAQSGKPHQLPLADLEPNPANRRKLAIPLDEFLKALRIGEADSLVYVEDECLVFPEREDLIDLGVALDLRTKKEEEFYDKIRELAQSIYQHDLLYPVQCSPIEGTKKYLIEIGHRRWFASHFVPDRTKVESVLKSDIKTELKKALRRRDENAVRHDLSLLENIDEIAHIIELTKAEQGGKISQVKLAASLSMSKHEMSYFVKIIKADLADSERAILDDNGLNDLKTVAEICRLTDRNQRFKAFQLYQDRGNTTARNFVGQCLAAEKGGDEPQKRAVPAAFRPKKVSTSQAGAERFVSELRAKAPELLGDLDSDDPVAILQAILKRFEQDEDQ